MKIRCVNCNTIIEGDKRGTYIACKCGKCAVDETKYYYRIIGDEGDFKIIDKDGVERDINK